MSRKQAREISFKMIFEFIFSKKVSNALLNDYKQENNLTDDDVNYAITLIDRTRENYANIIEVIENNLVGYTLDRIYKVDLAIILIATSELMYSKEIADKIIINEAVELSKKYSTEKSYSFINGLLAKINTSIGKK